MASNVVEVPIWFENVTSRILQPCWIVFIQVKPRSCIPDCYDMEIPRGPGLGSLLTNSGLRGSIGRLQQSHELEYLIDCSKFMTQVGIGCQEI